MSRLLVVILLTACLAVLGFQPVLAMTAFEADPEKSGNACDYTSDGSEGENLDNSRDSNRVIDVIKSRFVGSDLDTVDDQGAPASGIQITCVRFHPFAISNNGNESSQLEATVVGDVDIVAVAVLIPNDAFYLKVDGQFVEPGATISLFDDGTHGDRIAGDRIWSRNQIVADTSSNPSFIDRYELQFHRFVVDNGTDVSIVDLQAATGSLHAYAPLVIVEKRLVQRVEDKAEHIQIGSHVVNLSGASEALAVQNQQLELVSQRFYQNFADDYDFLVFMSDAPVRDAPFGSYHHVRNDVQNIGLTLFDGASAYGSGGRLQGAIFLNTIINGPVIHEFLHRWAVHGFHETELDLTQCSDSSHWGLAGIGFSPFSGFAIGSLVDNQDGTYTAEVGSLNFPFNSLEQYLAGFIAPANVPPMWVPINPDCRTIEYDSTTYPVQATFRADGIRTVTIDDVIVALGGPRTPDHEHSQKNFKAAWIVVSPTPLTPTEMAVFNQKSRILSGAVLPPEFSRGSLPRNAYLSFYTASGGAATMDTSMFEPMTSQIDAWVDAPSLVGTQAETLSLIPVSYGNSGASATRSMTITLTMPISVTYQGDDSGVNPTIAHSVDSSTLTWTAANVAGLEAQTYTVQVALPQGDDGSPLPLGTHFPYSLSVAALGEPEDLLSNNTISGQVMVSQNMYLPQIEKD